jgi:hypothetical protein
MRVTTYTALAVGLMLPGIVGTAFAKEPKVARFSSEPLFVKGSGSCEGVDCADLDGDGKLDIVSGIPMKGGIHFYRSTGTAEKPVFTNRVVLADSKTGERVKFSHW